MTPEHAYYLATGLFGLMTCVGGFFLNMLLMEGRFTSKATFDQAQVSVLKLCDKMSRALDDLTKEHEDRGMSCPVRVVESRQAIVSGNVGSIQKKLDDVIFKVGAIEARQAMKLDELADIRDQLNAMGKQVGRVEGFLSAGGKLSDH